MNSSLVIKNQMKVADEVMKNLETFDPTCILAGGAPRDWYFGNLATDLDFFVYWRPDFESQKWRYKKMLESLGFTHINNKTGEGMPENYKRNPHLVTVFEFDYKNETIQVMFMNEKTFTCVVDLFPFGICQAWYKSPDNGQQGWRRASTGIQVTKEFEYSEKHKVLRLVNDLYNDEDGYVEKIISKFPDYKYIGKGE